jgi:hypothetical protein
VTSSTTTTENSSLNPRLATQINEYIDQVLSLPGESWPKSLNHEASQELLKEVARHALAHPDNLDMRAWHSDCGTAHCIAGWAVHLAGARGYALEARFDAAAAGFLLLGAWAATHFHDSDPEGREFLQSVLEGQ